jgi:hypothetical protein
MLLCFSERPWGCSEYIRNQAAARLEGIGKATEHDVGNMRMMSCFIAAEHAHIKGRLNKPPFLFDILPVHCYYCIGTFIGLPNCYPDDKKPYQSTS